MHAALLDELLQRDVPEDNTAFWACLRRAYPHAASDSSEYEMVCTWQAACVHMLQMLCDLLAASSWHARPAQNIVGSWS